MAAVRDAGGAVRTYTAGTADLVERGPVPADGFVRIGSGTKTYVAVVVLQLAGEGRVDLDAPIGSYLPGAARGRGTDGRRVTVRQLLRHTSGLPDYEPLLDADVFRRRRVHHRPERLLDLALAHGPDFAPGSGWGYSNTNYILLGLLVQKVTGRPLAREVAHRILRPLGLRHTYFPGTGELGIRQPHARGYHANEPGGPLRDITVMDPSWGWAAGAMIATPDDVNRFLVAVLDGRLLAPEQRRELRGTVPAPALWRGARYGLGLISTPLSCGGLMWGHGGDIPGYETRSGATDDGRAVTVTVTALPTALRRGAAAARHVLALVDTALCGPARRRPGA
ncbi:serine hydrolase domain-containing protein [Streptomyces sp. HMX112]|uniref:serine hydrolase domain-containing protein n=1 Tax=Streptomyces sp. HMX112 TaxID=3390850 RepID=UPI003A7FC257